MNKIIRITRKIGGFDKVFKNQIKRTLRKKMEDKSKKYLTRIINIIYEIFEYFGFDIDQKLSRMIDDAILKELENKEGFDVDTIIDKVIEQMNSKL